MKITNIILFLLMIFSFENIFAVNSKKYEARIAVVDLHLVLEKSIAIQGMNHEISNIGAGLEKVMHAKEVELKKDEESIIQKRGKVTEEEFEKEVSKFNKKLSEAQNMMQDKKSRLDRAHASGMQQVHDAIIDIIKSLTKEHDFNIVVQSSVSLYYVEALDITEMVISRLNKKLTTIPFNY